MDELEKLSDMIRDIQRAKCNSRLSVLLHADLSGRALDPLVESRYESFENFVDYHGELTDPKYKLRKRERQLEQELHEVRAELYDYVLDDNGEVPF